VTVAATAQDYDLVLKGRHVIDGKNRIDGIRDVATREARDQLGNVYLRESKVADVLAQAPGTAEGLR